MPLEPTLTKSQLEDWKLYRCIDKSSYGLGYDPDTPLRQLTKKAAKSFCQPGLNISCRWRHRSSWISLWRVTRQGPRKLIKLVRFLWWWKGIVRLHRRTILWFRRAIVSKRSALLRPSFSRWLGSSHSKSWEEYRSRRFLDRNGAIVLKCPWKSRRSCWVGSLRKYCGGTTFKPSNRILCSKDRLGNTW